MINRVQIEPITSLNKNPGQFLQKLESGPIYLAQHSKGVAVMLSLELWEDVRSRLNAIDELSHALILAKDTDPDAWVPFEEVEKDMKEKGLINV